MGIISSTDLKPEHKPQIPETPEKVGDPTSGWRARFEEFNKGGPCKKGYMDFQDCADEAEKNNESIRKCSPMLEKCMEANSHYYHPVLQVLKNGEELIMTASKSTFSLNEEKSLEILEDEIITFMKGGPCKESFMAYYHCIYSEEPERCARLSATWAKCMDVNSDYHHPFLELKKTVEEQLVEEFQVLFSEKN